MEMIDSIIRQIKPQVLGWISSWHAQQPYPLPFVCHDYVSSGIATVGSPFSATIPAALTVVSWSQTGYVATTNNSSNYWTVSLYRSLGASSIKIAEVSTKSWTAATWTNASVGIGQAIPSTDKMLYISVAKTGSPGALSLAGPVVWVR